MPAPVSRKKNLPIKSAAGGTSLTLRISEVARRVGISSSALRAWEQLGLVAPQRTKEPLSFVQRGGCAPAATGVVSSPRSRTESAAIVHVLKRQGAVPLPRRSCHASGPALSAAANASGTFPCASGARHRCLGRLPQFAGARTNAFLGGYVAPDCAVLSHEHSFALRKRPAKTLGWFGPRSEKSWRPMRACEWNSLHGATTAMEHICSALKPRGGSGESYSHEGEEFLHVFRGEFEIWLGDAEALPP